MEIIRSSSYSLDESLNESSEDNISEEKKFSDEELIFRVKNKKEMSIFFIGI